MWITNTEEHSWAYRLARRGFDVWMSNNRGNYWCQKHEKYTIKDKEFWQFDQEHFGIYDQPAFISKILEVTGYKKIAAYIGHS